MVPARPGSDDHGARAIIAVMTTPIPLADLDPRPEPPEAPLPSDCCDSGCPVCVFDSYSEELQAYREAVAAWKTRHPYAAD